MNKTQKLLLGVYLPITAVFLVLDHLFPASALALPLGILSFAIAYLIS